MADIKAFSAVRPRKDLADQIAALPYDVYTRKEAKKEVENHPLSFLRIDRAETQFSDDVDTYDACVYQKAHDLLWEMIEDGSFVREAVPCYYVYELTMDGRAQTGIVACSSVDDYINGKIKKHENTRTDKEQDRIQHIDTCDAQTGPIFLSYRSKDEINQIVENKKKESPLYAFTADDDVQHRVWRIAESELVNRLKEAFAAIDHIYIADGHHRAASAVKVGLKRREEHPSYKGDEEFNYFLSVLFPDDQLKIMDYNRMVKDLNGRTEADFLAEIRKTYDIEEKGASPFYPERKEQVGMCIKEKWYALTLKEEIVSDNPVGGLAVEVLQKNVLASILGIENPQTDPRIAFLGGIWGLDELGSRSKEDYAVVFAMYPTSMDELLAVADAGELMPPKSTWFEPKLRSGLFIHTIEAE